MIVSSPSTSTASDSNIENPLHVVPSTLSQTFTAENSSLTERSLASSEKATGQKTILLKKPLLPRNLVIQELDHLGEPLTLLEETGDDDDFAENPSIIEKKTTLVKESDINTEISSVEKYTNSEKPPCQNEDLTLQDLNAKEDLVSTKPKNIENSKAEMENPTKESLVLQKKCTIQKNVSGSDEPLPLAVKSFSEEQLLIKSLTFQNKPTTETEKVSPFQTSAALQEKHATVFQASAALQEKVTILKKPDIFQEDIERESQFVRESLSFRKQYNINAFSTKEKSLTNEGYITETMMITQQKVLDLRDVSNKDKNFHPVRPESPKKSSTKEATVTKASLSLKEQQSTQEILYLEKKTSEEKSLCKKVLNDEEKPSAEEVFLPKDPGAVEENTTLHAASLPKNLLTLQEKTNSEKESSIKKASTLQKKLMTKEEFSLLVKPSNKDKYVSRKTLPVQKNDIKKSSYQKFLTVSEKSTTREDGYYPRNQLFSRKTPIPEVAKSKEKQLSFKNNPIAQWKVAPLKNHMALQYHFTNEEGAIMNQKLALREKPITENETILQKEPVVLHEKHPVEEEAISKEPLTARENLSHEVTLCKQSVIFKERPTVNKVVRFKEAFVLNEKPTTSKMVYMNQSLTYEENPIHMKDNTISDLLSQTQNSPNKVSRPSECGTKKLRVVGISNMKKFSFANKFCTYNSNNDPVFNTVYAKDIFRYMKEREEKFKVNQYMPGQADISSDMRATLVDWLVELQVTFEMSHETLYLAVKLIDLYLMEVICRKEKLQLLGSTAFLVAAKFEEPKPPCMEDFLYVCDDMYSRHEMINMEIKVLQTLDFDINIPIAYHFLHAYAKFVPTNKQTVTLSHFICELTLQNYAFIEAKASKLAAASYLLSLYINNLKNKAPALETCSGYKISELYSLVLQLNILLSLSPTEDLKSIKLKYSHKVFFHVARTPPMNLLWLEKLMKNE
ncbi:G2/mitotic-specific cyclin-B3 [Sorex araneus]|uniref:G2/mitotic-specific cyclin-B3 n=1 Tax=Sorex araneus TaxID=42254 RepID=UPI002433C57E|nr:G2/mitotic-specific cyclin-B3 [Sorex araneus]